MSEACLICQNTEHNRIIKTREMMFGQREEFSYLECQSCGTIQLLSVPRELGAYYPPEYLSMGSIEDIDIAATRSRRIAAWFAGRYLRGEHCLIGKTVLALKPWVADHYPPSLSPNHTQTEFTNTRCRLRNGSSARNSSLFRVSQPIGRRRLHLSRDLDAKRDLDQTAEFGGNRRRI